MGGALNSAAVAPTTVRWCFFLLLFWLIGWPIVHLLEAALQEKGLMEAFSKVATVSFSVTTLRTAALAFAVAFCSTGFGVLVGWLLTFHSPPFRGFLNFGLIAPLVLPHYVLGIAWTYLMGSWIYGFAGCVFVLSACWFPLAALLSRRSFQETDTEARAAAMIEGADAWRLFWRIDLPLVAPVLTSSFVLVFIFTLIEFGIPSLFIVQVSSFEIYTQYSAFFDPTAATFAGAPILLVALVAMVVERFVRRGEPIRILGEDTERRFVSAHRTFLGWTGFCLAVIPVLLPLAVVFRQAISDGDLSGIPVAWDLVRAAVFPSVWISILSALLLMGVGGIIALCMDRRLFIRGGVRTRILGEAILMALLAIPPALWSLALLREWNRPNFLSLLIADSAGILLIGYLGRFLPVCYRIIRDALDSIPTEILESAWLDGASPVQVAKTIIVPLTKKALLMAGCIGLVLSFGELEVTLFCAPPGVATVPMRLYTVMANGPTNVVAGIIVFIVGIALLPIAAILLLSGAHRIAKRRGDS
jgi:iron(III) transport system permease protein